MSKEFKLRVYYEDTDSEGVVYYANYLKFLERARTQLLIDKGLNHTFFKKNFDIITVVKSCDINFIRPSKLDDELSILTTLIKKSKVQLLFNQKIFCKKILILEGKIRVVTINSKGNIVKMPLDLYNIL